MAKRRFLKNEVPSLSAADPFEEEQMATEIANENNFEPQK